ncbi:large conductance mechanosensitive channel protein MscL [Actinocorallia lasiicapitis]
MIDGFKKFLLRGNLVELAVAVVIGAQFGALVNQFVKSFISPLLTLVGGNPDLSSLKFTIRKSEFLYGDFLTVAISFLIAALVVYFVLVLPVARLLSYIDRNKTATTRDCPHCLTSVPLKAAVCAQCTRDIPNIPEPAVR